MINPGAAFFWKCRGEFGYHLWDLVKNKVIRSRDVTYNELEMFKMCTNDIKVKKIFNGLSHHCKNMGRKFKNVTNNKWKMMHTNKKKMCGILYKKSNHKTHHQNWFSHI